MFNKKLTAVITAITILGGATTAFAANESYKDNIKSARENVKKSAEGLRAKKGVVIKAFDSKKVEVGFTEVDKTQVSAKLQAIKALRAEIKGLQEAYKTAKAAKDKEKMESLKLKIKEKTEQVYSAVQDFSPIKEQLKKNKEVSKNIKPLKEQLKSMGDKRETIHEENKVIENDIKALRDSLKTAVKEDNQEQIASITDKIVSKLNVLNDNLIKLSNLKDEAVNMVNSWK